MKMRTQHGQWIITTDKGNEVVFTDSKEAWAFVFENAKKDGAKNAIHR